MLDPQSRDALERDRQPAKVEGRDLGHMKSAKGSNPFAVMHRLLRDMDHAALSNHRERSDLFQNVFEQALWSPDLEVFARGDVFVVRTELPGLRPEDLKVELEDGVLCISGERRHIWDGDPGENTSNEVTHGSFVRRLTLPLELREEDLTATFHEGVLEISFPGA